MALPAAAERREIGQASALKDAPPSCVAHGMCVEVLAAPGMAGTPPLAPTLAPHALAEGPPPVLR
jgi:hypothetical protein